MLRNYNSKYYFHYNFYIVFITITITGSHYIITYKLIDFLYIIYKIALLLFSNCKGNANII